MLYDRILENYNSNQNDEDVLKKELVNSCPASVEPIVTRKSARVFLKATTPSIHMPCTAVKTDKTPGRGASFKEVSAECIERCKECDGTYPMKRVLKDTDTVAYKKRGCDDDEGEEEEEEEPRSKQRKTTKTTFVAAGPKDHRRDCSLCKSKTQWYCNGCRRYLCNKPPKDGKDRLDNKYPKLFSINTPVLNEDGGLKRNENGEPVFEKSHGELTCWHIVHSDKWRWSRVFKNGVRKAAVAVSAEDKGKKPEASGTSKKAAKKGRAVESSEEVQVETPRSRRNKK